MKHGDPHLHVRGESVFVDDLATTTGTLHAAVLGSPVAHGAITRLDPAPALQEPGVVAVLTADDIPGENQIGAIIADEPLLAHGTVHHVGQPVAVVLATSPAAARRARTAIALDIDPWPAITDPREAARRGHLLLPARTFACGDVDAALARSAHVVRGRVRTGAQEHWYLETQGAVAEPGEHGAVVVHSSTQSPTGVQRQVARVLGVPMHQVQVDVRRLGGAFGGKEDQATPWAVICALGARVTGRPVRLILDRQEDLAMTGKRHPYDADYALGLDAEGNFLAWQVTYHQNAGSAADLSPAILERTLFHSTGSYHVPSVRATGLSCRTNLPPLTAFRGFGGPQAMLVMEAAIAHAARELGVPAHELQHRNLLAEGSSFPYGMTAERCQARRCWEAADRAYGIAARVRAAAEHNRTARGTRRGVAVMPVCFGISFTNTMLNQAGALVHVYTDGSVGVSTGAVEMGQGVNRKLQRIVARSLDIEPERVRLETTNTTRVANTSPTAASTGADLNGRAAQLACEQIRRRLEPVAARLEAEGSSSPGWEELIAAAYQARVDLAAHAHYATPRLHFDRATETGRPFAYHVYGPAVVEVTLDVLRGTSTVDAVRLVHDVGRSLDPQIDRGQIEGALAQGLGWVLLEDVRWDPNGRLLHDTAGKCKVPDLAFMPGQVEIALLEEAENPEAVLGSKAVGEPPFMYGIGAWLALQQAILAANPAAARDPAAAPLTPERTLDLLVGGFATSSAPSGDPASPHPATTTPEETQP